MHHLFARSLFFACGTGWTVAPPLPQGMDGAGYSRQNIQEIPAVGNQNPIQRRKA